MNPPCSHSLLSRVNHGWNALEPIALGLTAMEHSFLLLGRHGTGKSRIARFLGSVIGEENGFVSYDAAKDDLISVAGIPDPQGLKEGRFTFVPHQRAIWGKTAVFIDEITRAGKESQNLWLEILENHSLCGVPLSFRLLIGAANPESYASAFQFDEALLDRFQAVLPINGWGSARAEDIVAMTRLALGPEPREVAIETRNLIAQIRQAHASLITEDWPERIARFLGGFLPLLQRRLEEQKDCYLSPRTAVRNFPLCLMATAAYHRAMGRANSVAMAAPDALAYAIASRLQLPLDPLLPILEARLELLNDTCTPRDSRRVALAGLSDFEEKLAFLRQHGADLFQELTPDEWQKEWGELSSDPRLTITKLSALHEAMLALNVNGQARRAVDGRLTMKLYDARRRLDAVLKQWKTDPDQAQDLPAGKIAAFLTRLNEMQLQQGASLSPFAVAAVEAITAAPNFGALRTLVWEQQLPAVAEAVSS